MRRRSDGLSKLKPLWNDHAKLAGGQAALLGALAAYLKGDEDLPKSGGPGLQVWLKSRRWENWLDLPTTTAEAAMHAQRFPEPHRSAIVARLGEPFVRSYIDPCEMDGTVLIVRTDTAVKKLGEHRFVFRALGFSGMRRKPLTP